MTDAAERFIAEAEATWDHQRVAQVARSGLTMADQQTLAAYCDGTEDRCAQAIGEVYVWACREDSYLSRGEGPRR